MGTTFNSAIWNGPGSAPAVGGVSAKRIIYHGFRIAGITRGPGREPSPDQFADGFERLNTMIDTWALQRLNIPSTQRTEWPVTIGQQEYLIGPTGDWQMPRPNRIDMASYVYTDSDPWVERPMDIMTVQIWAAVSPKNMPGPIPYKLYYNTDVPDGVVTLWPVPTDDQVRIALYTGQYLRQFVSLDDQVYLGPAYTETLEFQLALRLAAAFPERQMMNDQARMEAERCYRALRSANSPELLAQCERAISRDISSGRFDILTNTWK